MKRRLVLVLLLALLSCLAPAAPAARGSLPQRTYVPLVVSQNPKLLIAALHYDGIVSGEPDEAFGLYNPGELPVDLAGWRLQSGSRTVTFPAMSLPARASLWCGREATAFRRSFGHPPDCEWAADTDPSVPNLQGTGVTFSNSGAAVVLRRADGTTSDLLVYKAGTVPADGGWRGAAVYPYKPSSAFHEQGQVLYRKLDPLRASPVRDTDSAADWASDPDDILEGRRVRYAGWSLERFFFPAVSDEEAELQIFVAPDHAYEALSVRLASATRSITFEGYTFESAPLAAIVAQEARTGVLVTILLEGAPPGGVSDQQRWAVQQMVEAGAKVFYMRADSREGIRDRYTNQHAKIWLLDDRLALIGSENPSPDSFPDDDKSDGTNGRRGVYVGTDAPGVVARIRDIIAADIDPALPDIWSYDPADPDLGAPPPDFTPILTSGGNHHPVRMVQPLSLSGRAHFELCHAPEHSLSTNACLLGLVGKAGAGDTLLIEQLDEPIHWGPSNASVESDPNPRLQAYIAAARRGAKVRILLDSFFDDLSSSRSNLRTQEYLMAIARSEGLDLQVRRGNPTGLGLHNKMVLAEIGGHGWAMVGSLNGGEASAKLNREVSLVVQSDEVYAYLAAMFLGDWDWQP